MKIVNLIDVIKIQHILEAFNNINVFRGSFHEDGNAISEDRDCCEDTQDGEDEGANGINNVPFWFEVNDNGSDDDSDTLDDISNDVNDSCSDVHVFVTVPVMPMAMAVSMSM